MRVVAWFIQLVFWICCAFPVRDKITFLSRQSPKPFDFKLLEPTLNKVLPDFMTVWACVPPSGAMGLGLVLRQVWHVATSRICLVDGYVPAVCIPRGRRKAYCIQMWHALGAIKCFGYQALDTSEGRTSKMARALSMHRGYDIIVAGLPGSVQAFCRAFDCDAGKILPLGLPRFDYLRNPRFASLREERLNLAEENIRQKSPRFGSAKIILYAPTFRRDSQGDDAWLMRSVQDIDNHLPEDGSMMLLVAGHPLQAEKHSKNNNHLFLRGVATIDALEFADYVVTDYSAIAFEAALLNKKVLFYVPDIENYSLSPGLNINPLDQYSEISFKCASQLARALVRDVAHHTLKTFDYYASDYLGDTEVGCVDRIARFVHEVLQRSDSG